MEWELSLHYKVHLFGKIYGSFFGFLTALTFHAFFNTSCVFSCMLLATKLHCVVGRVVVFIVLVLFVVSTLQFHCVNKSDYCNYHNVNFFNDIKNYTGMIRNNMIWHTPM